MAFKPFKPKFERTDHGLVEFFADLIRDRSLYVKETDKWYTYDGCRYEEGDTQIYNWYKDLLDAIVLEVDIFYEEELQRLHSAISEDRRLEIRGLADEQLTTDEKILKRIWTEQALAAKWRKSASGFVKIQGVLKYVNNNAHIRIKLDKLDSKGEYLSTKNGVLNLNTLHLATNDPKYYVTKQCNGKYDPSADCPNFKTVVNNLAMGDPEIVKFLQLVAGQAVIGIPIQQELIILRGGGDNGKSMFMRSLVHALGDYAIAGDPSILTTNSNIEDYHFASFVGKRLILFDELPEKAHLKEQNYKKLVGNGGKVSAREVRGKRFEFQPTATLVLTTNPKPNIVGTDHGTWKRIAMMYSTYQISPEDKITDYFERYLEPEVDGILTWMIEGACELLHTHNSKIPYPQAVIDETMTYRSDQDTVGSFIEQTLEETSLEQKVKMSDVYKAYSTFAKNSGTNPISLKNFKSDLERRKYSNDSQYMIKKSTGNQDWLFGFTMEFVSEFGAGGDRDYTSHATQDEIDSDPRIQKSIKDQKDKGDKFKEDMKQVVAKSTVEFH